MSPKGRFKLVVNPLLILFGRPIQELNGYNSQFIEADIPDLLMCLFPIAFLRYVLTHLRRLVSLCNFPLVVEFYG